MEELRFENSDLILIHNLLIEDAERWEKEGYPAHAKDRRSLASKAKAEVERREPATR